MARVLVTRPQPAAAVTEAALVAAGHAPVLSPLMETVPCDWVAPQALPDAVMLTSAAAVRLAGAGADALKALPAHCVGEKTTSAARAAGWTRAEMAGLDLVALMATAASRVAGRAGLLRILHLCGEDRATADIPDGVLIERRVVYAARLLPLADPGPVQAVLLFSPRSAAHFASEWDRLGLARNRLSLAVISPAAARMAGAGWARVAVAAQPDEASLLAALTTLGL